MINCDTGFVARPKARIEIIPLIDVIFFLLATFVLFTLSLEKLRSIEVVLPLGGIDRGEGDSTVFIQTSADGAFFWKKGRDGPAELISASEIGPRLANYKRTVSVPRVLIRTDRTAKFGAAIVVLDEVRKAGIAQVSIETAAVATGG